MNSTELIIHQAEDVDFFATGFGEGITQEENWGV